MNDKSSSGANRDIVVPVIEETAILKKRTAKTGTVRVRTVADTMLEHVTADLQEQEVEVERVIINREVTEIPEIRTENDVTIVPVLEEVLVVEKRLVLKEELHIRRTSKTHRVEVPVSLQKQRAIIEREHDAQPNPYEEDQT